MAKFGSKKKADGGWFSKGEEAAAVARQQAASTFKPEFWLLDGESAEVIFLDKESFNIFVHQVKVRGRLRKYTCRRKGCPLCKTDDPRIISVYRVIDLRQFAPKDAKKGDKKPLKKEYKQKYYEAGSRIQPTIAKLMDKGLLYKKVCEISRTGAGTQTTYQIIPIGPIDENLRATLKKRGLMTPELNIEEDYAPKPVEDLDMLADLFEDDDDAPAAPAPRGESTTSRRSYLEDDDDDDGAEDDEEAATTEDEDDD
jgi:hypothetical protein